ncbi:hypothetical protein P691DRAFT_799021 [Macrolepiota fuliginosa MF-IS2]|uniref:Uncharacterized protein n=1 Tax=Macrolepiota fuliginosa MF-IS2 TaxID=1400762 RepID=A0A9P6BXU7_9AGAR|nr:hypothetical protein P691DRAFT_799021 [Macrolepiota fuliginosa MF-IS2]
MALFCPCRDLCCHRGIHIHRAASLILSSNAWANAPLSLNTVSRGSQASFSIPSRDESMIALALWSLASPCIISNNANDLQDGFASWMGAFPSGSVLAAEGLSPGPSFEVGISSDSPLHEVISSDLLFGDSTSNQAILFSHNLTNLLLLASPHYSNYALPAANSSLIDPPSRPPNVTTIIALTPLTNYTVLIVQDSHKVSDPIHIHTKSTSFVCTLIHAIPFCPSTAYSLPFPIPPNTGFSTLPTEISTQLVDVLSNFTTSLTTFTCGCTGYSPLVCCDDCQREYRSSRAPIGFTNAGPTPTTNPSSQQVFPALPIPISQSSSDRLNPPYMSSPYTRLLLCIKTCTSMDHACPPFLGFRCPSVMFNGASSHGFGYIDGAEGDERGGVTGVAQDRWGNIWCFSECPRSSPRPEPAF